MFHRTGRRASAVTQGDRSPYTGPPSLPSSSGRGRGRKPTRQESAAEMTPNTMETLSRDFTVQSSPTIEVPGESSPDNAPRENARDREQPPPPQTATGGTPSTLEDRLARMESTVATLVECYQQQRDRAQPGAYASTSEAGPPAIVANHELLGAIRPSLPTNDCTQLH